jgi:hypothetical protein
MMEKTKYKRSFGELPSLCFWCLDCLTSLFVCILLPFVVVVVGKGEMTNKIRNDRFSKKKKPVNYASG